MYIAEAPSFLEQKTPYNKGLKEQTKGEKAKLVQSSHIPPPLLFHLHSFYHLPNQPINHSFNTAIMPAS